MALFVVLVRVAFRLVFGGFSIEGVFLALVEGGKLALWVLGFGVLNLVVDFRQLLKSSPKALRKFNTALSIALSLTPELAQSYLRVKSAAALRAHRRGFHFVRSVIVPVVSNAIDQSVALADSMDARGFGRKLLPASGEIVLNDLNFRYKGAGPILDGVSLRIPKGQFVLITGQTGSGKSTLLKVIGAKVPGVGFVSQFPRQSFVAGTVFDELAFSLVQRGIRGQELQGRVTGMAKQFELDLKASPLELSAGWQQRLAMAAALSSGADILLLDEPFSALDDPGRNQVMDILKTLKSQGVTIILSEHRIKPLLRLADVVLEVSAGSLREVKAKPVPLDSKSITGKVTVLIGDNGSGKTTYLRKLAEVSGALVPQPASDLLFHDSVASELQQADLDANVPAGTTAAILNNFALNLDESQNPRDLSEGQKLLLALSIQLAKQEDLLMLDEPTLGLDTASRQHLVDIVSDLANRGVKILIATHDREFADAIGTEVLEVESVRQ